MTQTRISVEDGKYIVVHDNGANLHCLRHGRPWRDLLGDGMVLALVQRIEELESQVKASQPIGVVKHHNVGGSGEFHNVEWSGAVPESGKKLYTNPATKAPEPSTTGSK